MSDISIKLSKELEKKLDMLASELHIEKEAMLQSLVCIGMKEKLIDYAITQFINKKVTLAKAAEIAGITLRHMIEILGEKGVPLHVSEENIQEDFEAAMQ